jgi:hypothetical protein
LRSCPKLFGHFDPTASLVRIICLIGTPPTFARLFHQHVVVEFVFIHPQECVSNRTVPNTCAFRDEIRPLLDAGIHCVF